MVTSHIFRFHRTVIYTVFPLQAPFTFAHPWPAYHTWIFPLTYARLTPDTWRFSSFPSSHAP